ncbi:anti-repressor SinI family protein [Virgibacillus profundi]|nr:anti-repressor SinI family protein [Virgibacillus profundi]PXY55186.1 DNA-binding anti-repressor SinI [Virgibacillus profundi]
MEKTAENITLDREWIKLMMEAKTLGLTVDEVRLFLAETGGK